LARFVVGSHSRSHPLSQTNNDSMEVEPESQLAQESQAAAKRDGKDDTEIPQELLRKYILYAREHCHPKLLHIDEDKVARLFADMRRESLATGAYPITVSTYLFVTGNRANLTCLSGPSLGGHHPYLRVLLPHAPVRVLLGPGH
jgi:DNA replicative helicase MCM subunit Mcm2 (Cdc46/Mcm family)